MFNRLRAAWHGETSGLTAAAVIVGVASLASRVVGLFRDRILASTFGAGNALDTYYAAFRIPDFLYNLIILGALSAGFIPVFSEYLAKRGEKEAWQLSERVLSLVGATMAVCCVVLAFAATVDLKNPSMIDWETYPIRSGRFYETRGSLEPVEVKKASSFPTPDARVVVILHKDHRIYYSAKNDSYTPFILPPALTRDTRSYVQSYFRETYGLELSVRPVHEKWISEDGIPYIAVNAQIQTGVYIFKEYSRSEAKGILDSL